MAFALTKYIFPIESIIVSESSSYSFDNPRTPEEIKIVKDFIEKTINERDEDETGMFAPQSTRLFLSLHDLKKNLEETGNHKYALDFYEKNKEKSYLDLLAETWIILRFEEDEEFNEIANDKNKLFHILLSHKETAYTKYFRNLTSYCHLLSLLAHNEENEYYGENFLLSESPYELFITSINEKIYESIETFIRYNCLLKHDSRAKNWLYWLDGSENLILHSERIESIIIQETIKDESGKIRISQKQSPKQKLLHAGNILKTSYKHLQDPELMLLLLVSNIEYLLTRNPDTNKFNVEDSISRQFKLKCAVAIHNQNKDLSLVTLNKDLNKVYSQRSDLAHGNYREDFKIDEIVQSVYLLYNITNLIINEFIDDRGIIEYLKDN